MARAEQKQRAVTVRTRRTSRGAPNRSGSAVTLLAASVLAAAWAGGMLTGAGRTAYSYLFFFTEFYAGVVTLVALSLTVMLGLLATDRLVLLVPHRLLMQSAHRATGIIGVSGLVLHVLTKIATGRASATDAAVPFLGGRGLYVGLGTVAALLMVTVLWTGLVRARFAGVGPRWLWRSLHATAYLSWPFSLLHGLGAGRAPATWVTLSYLACVLLVLVALVVRLSANLGRRRRERSQNAALDRAVAGRGAERTSLRVRLTRRRAADPEATPYRDRTGRHDRGWTARPEPGRRPDRVDRDAWSTARADRRSGRFTVPVVPPPGTVPRTAPAGRRRRRAEDRTATPYAPTTDPLLTPAAATPYAPTVARHAAADPGWPGWTSEPEEPWDSPTRWSGSARKGPLLTPAVEEGPPPNADSTRSTRSARRAGGIGGTADLDGIGGIGRTGTGGRHSADDEVPDLVTEYWRPPARYVPDDTPLPPDDTPTLVDLAARRARRAAGESRSARRRRAHADAVDGAYWAGLRGEAK